MRPLPLFATAALLSLAACSDAPANGEAQKEKAESAPSIAAVELTGRVTDAAEILDAAQEARLTASLEALERSKSHQMVVVTVPTLSGQDVAKFTTNLGNAWGIGREDQDDGIIILVAPNERRVRIAVGYGLEKKLPDALCKRIIDERMLPHFREGDYAAGLEAGVGALLLQLMK